MNLEIPHALAVKLLRSLQDDKNIRITITTSSLLKFPGKCSEWVSDNWVFHDRRFCQIIWQIFIQGRAKKISSKIAPSGDWNQDLRIMRPMPYQLS